VAQNERFVVSFQFFDAPDVAGPSLVRDTDGNPGGRNTIDADLGGGTFTWLDSTFFGVTGDWAIRAVVDCQSVPTNADVSVTASALPSAYTPGLALAYTLTISNAGPAGSPNTTIIDSFPAAYIAPTWICAGSGGAACAASGSGNIVATNVNLPAGSSVVYTVSGTVASGTTGTLGNSVTAAVGSPASDPIGSNNTATINLNLGNDVIFADGFGG